MKKFCKDIKEHGTEIIYYEKRKWKERKIYRKQKFCHICTKKFSNYNDNDKKHYKVQDHFHYNEKCRGAAHNVFNLRYQKQFLWCFIMILIMTII